MLGATNIPWELDPAIRRRSFLMRRGKEKSPKHFRFEKRVYISLPDEAARTHMFKVHVGDTPNTLTEADYKTLGQRTDGFSGSDISVVVRDAMYEPLRTCQMATHFRQVKEPTSHLASRLIGSG